MKLHNLKILPLQPSFAISTSNRTLAGKFYAVSTKSTLIRKLSFPYGSGSTLTTGTSLLSKNLFSGTGGISSGRTKGLSLFVLTSTAFSVISLLSERLLWGKIS